MENFQVYLAQKIDFMTRAELLFGAEYLWQERGPAVRFKVDERAFLLARGEGECRLWEEVAGSRRELLCLSDEEGQFEDRLLAAIGEALEKTAS